MGPSQAAQIRPRSRAGPCLPAGLLSLSATNGRGQKPAAVALSGPGLRPWHSAVPCFPKCIQRYGPELKAGASQLRLFSPSRPHTVPLSNGEGRHILQQNHPATSLQVRRVRSRSVSGGVRQWPSGAAAGRNCGRNAHFLPPVSAVLQADAVSNDFCLLVAPLVAQQCIFH